MYKIASENAQRRVSRVQMADQMQERSLVSLDDQYSALVRVIHSIEVELKDPLLTVDRRVALGKRKMETQATIKELKPKLQIKSRQENGGIQHYFMTAAKQILDPAKFKIIMNAAKIDYDREAAALAKITGGEP